MARDVEITFDGELSGIKESLDGLSSYVQGWGSTIKSIGVAAFGGWAVKEALGFAKEFMAAASESAQVDAKLGAVLEASGHAAGYSSEQLNKLANDLQKVTLFDDEAVKGAETMIATFSEIRGNEFERTTKLALDMATVMGGDASSAASQLGKAINDPVRGMQLLARQGVEFSESQQKAIENMVKSGDVAGAQGMLLDELGKKYGGAAEAAAGAAGGGMVQFWNIVDNIKESIGTGLLAVLDPLMPLFKQGAELVGGWADSFAAMGPEISNFVEGGINWVADAFNFMLEVGSNALGELGDLWQWAFGETASESAGTIFDFVKSIFIGLLEYGVGFGSAMQTVWENLGETAEFVWNAIKLGVVTLYEDDKHILTVAIPEILRWFFDNWKQIFTDIYFATGAIVSNMFDNIVDFFANVWALLSGGETDWKWHGLLDGFEATLKELPNIAGREMTALETELAAKTGEQGASLANKFQDKFKANMKALGFGDDIESPAAATAKETAKPGSGKAGEPPARKDLAGDGKDGKDDKAAFEDLGALFKRIQAAAAGGGSPELKEAKKTADATEQTKEHTRESKDKLGRIEGHLEKIASRGGVNNAVPTYQ